MIKDTLLAYNRIQHMATSSQTYYPSEQAAILSIHILPWEILAHIFSLVCNVHPHTCHAEVEYHRHCEEWPGPRPFPKEPVRLSHVCSYWRRITINLASLWSHIDLYPDHFSHPVLSALLEAFVARSAQASLDAHLITVLPGSRTDSQALCDAPLTATSTNGTIFPFLGTIAPRIRSLIIQSTYTDNANFCCSALATCLANCAPGTLLEIEVETFMPLILDTIIEKVRDRGVEESRLEALLLSLKILRLRRSFLNWSSKAYHGLTELRLFNCFAPSPSVLVSIFRSSPQLCVFGLNELTWWKPFPDHSSLTPVHLDELEVLALELSSDSYLGAVLSLIIPGSKPLSISILNPKYSGTGSRKELQHFTARANIIRFCTTGFWGFSKLAEVLDLAPKFRLVVLPRADPEPNNDRDDSGPGVPPNPNLTGLYVIYSDQPKWSDIERLVHRHNDPSIALWRNEFRVYDASSGKRLFPDNLHTICPVVGVTSNREPDTVQEVPGHWP